MMMVYADFHAPDLIAAARVMEGHDRVGVGNSMGLLGRDHVYEFEVR